MPELIQHILSFLPGLMLIASILLLRPHLFNPARRASLLRPVNLARPSVSLFDGLIVVGIALFFLLLNILASFHHAGETTRLSHSNLLLLMTFTLLWGAPAAALLCRSGGSLAETFGIDKQTAWHNIRAGLRYGVMMLFPVFAAGFLTHLIFHVLGLPVHTQDTLLQLANPESPLLLRTVLGVYLFTLVPLVEETAFRGVLLPAFAHVEPFRPLVIYQALFFSLIHFNAAAAPALFVVGLCLALGYARTRSLLTPVAMHAVLNFNAILHVIANAA